MRRIFFNHSRVIIAWRQIGVQGTWIVSSKWRTIMLAGNNVRLGFESRDHPVTEHFMAIV